MSEDSAAGLASADLGVLRLDHVGVAVADLDAAIELYESVLGLRCVHQEIKVEQGVREAMLAVGPDSRGTCIQLLAPLSPDSTVAKFLDRHGPGLHHVAGTVADVELACDRLRERGLRLVYDAPRRGTA